MVSKSLHNSQFWPDFETIGIDKYRISYDNYFFILAWYWNKFLTFNFWEVKGFRLEYKLSGKKIQHI